MIRSIYIDISAILTSVIAAERLAVYILAGVKRKRGK